MRRRGYVLDHERAHGRDLDRLHLTVLPRGQPTAEWLERRFGAEVDLAPVRPAPRVPAGGVPARAAARALRRGHDASACGAFFEARGLDYNPHPDVVPNTMRALQLTELARDHGRHERVARPADGRVLGRGAGHRRRGRAARARGRGRAAGGRRRGRARRRPLPRPRRGLDAAGRLDRRERGPRLPARPAAARARRAAARGRSSRRSRS